MSWTLHPIADFPRHAARWDQLTQSLGHAVFLESAFLLPLLQEFGAEQELLLALQAEDDGKSLRAGAIVRRCGAGRWEVFQPSQLPLGSWMIKDSGHSLEQQAKALLSALPGYALSLGLPQLDSLLLPRPANSASLRTQDYIETAWVDVDGGFDAYWESRGKNLRQNSKKQRNKLAAEGLQTQLECISEPAAVAQAIADYGALESAGWKAADGTAIHPDNAQGRFYRKMLENFCAQGRGRIYRYRFGDKVVSMDLCIESGPVIVILKTAYDESYRTVSPSTLMRQEQFQQLFEQARHRRIEFYGKVMEWHTRWTDKARPIYHATCYRWPLVGTVHAQLARHRQRLAARRQPALADAPTGDKE
ncbi:GNAT family N-acetyltransferase [Paucibacter sp. PLA-PC-4]|uniref:GNAT family N-acetyltransferase n=1 Tax=Paucibacter sp. PLA-PC-4 TaxID=2993655 RepID=UPI00224AE806|nr:GNAT family N-acetyltransferase [Paucibacter sp. PLA-PC-4]MCX2865007.1 GNAT family N-acetyltransferase [Paucibacter sp. PLA-PC-4]